MKNVLHIFSSIEYSGAEVMVSSAINCFERHGFRTYVLATGVEIGAYAKQMEAAGARVLHIELRSVVPHVLSLWWVVRKNNITVIHIHMESRHYYLWISVLAKLLGLKCIRTIHSKFEPNGMLRQFGKILVRNIPRLLGCRYVSVSDSVYYNEQRYHHIKTKIIRNWIDNTRYKFVSQEERVAAKESLNIDPKKLVVLSVGNCSSVKNHVFIIENISEILRSYPNFLYVHVGKEDSCHSEASYARDLGIIDYIEFTGPTNEVYKYLAAADCFVMPSIYEGVGVAALEALSCGVPSVVSNVPGLDTLKRYMPLINYFQSGNCREFIQKIPTAVGVDEDFRKAVAELVQSDYSVDLGVREYVQLYRS